MYVRSRGVKRKQSFKRAKRRQNIFELANRYPLQKGMHIVCPKEIGRLRKGFNVIPAIKNVYHAKTNSEKHGKRNYKYGDMKRYLSCEEQVKNYRGVL